jgi:primosomal protein N' (replication factor Y)
MTTAASFADVALPIRLDRTFTYSIPSELASSVTIGSLVLCPFGTKRLTGIVVDILHTTTIEKLRPLIDVLDNKPIISKELLSLARWISGYYCTPLGEVLRAFLPPGFTSGLKKLVSLRPGLPDQLLQSLIIQHSQKSALIAALQKNGSMTHTALIKVLGGKNISSILRTLSEEEIIEIHEQKSRSALRPHQELFFRKRMELPDISLKGKNQRILIERIKALPLEAFPVRDLLRETGCSISTLKSLAAMNLIEIFFQEMERKRVDEYFEPETKPIVELTQYQTEALAHITGALTQQVSEIFLLHGITGSGKTQVYIEALRAVLNQGKTAIVLVPEISLTPQIVSRFRQHFREHVIVMHSRMSPGERYDAWRFTRRGKYPIVVGPRSAVFAPLSNLGLIVVDEEHEASYKQFDATPRYHARDVAVVRGRECGAVVVLGSATPSIDSYYNVQREKYRLLTLPDRIDGAVLPPVTLVDMTEEQKRRYASQKERAKTLGRKAFEEEPSSLSELLRSKIADRLHKHEGIILLQNRRGFAPIIECLECGYVERCHRCEVTLTYHRAKNHLRCHYCGITKPTPDSCLQCRGIQLKLYGFGTQRIEEELRSLFPTAAIARMDLDTTTRRGSHERLLTQFAHGKIDILLGTQMVAKGLDFPNVTLVGVISADTQLFLPDFRSAERAFQLLTQVAGRAGRSVKAGEVIIQSYQVRHYALLHAVHHDYQSFYKEEISYRQETNYPPVTRLILVELKGKKESILEEMATEIAQRIRKLNTDVILLGPAPAILSKIQNNYRWHLVIKVPRTVDPNGAHIRSLLVSVISTLQQTSRFRDVKVVIDIDPQGIM